MSGSFDAVISSGLATIRQTATAAGNSIDKLADSMGVAGDKGRRQFRKIGEAINKMGGPLGEIGGKLFGAAGMEGGLSRLAVAAVAVGITFKVLSAQIAMAEARAKAFADAAASLREVHRGADKARESFAAGSESTGRLTAAAESVYGPGAAQIAKDYGTTFKQDPAEILRAMVETRKIPAELGVRALRIALTAARTQEASPTELVQKLTDHATLLRVLSAKKQDGLTDDESQAAMLLALDRGVSGPSAMRDAAISVRMSRVRPGPAQGHVPGVNSARGLQTTEQIKAFTNSETELAVRNSVTAAINPLAAAMLEWKAKNDEAIQKLQDTARAVGPVIEVIKDLGRGFGGEGSNENQIDRLNMSTGDAVTGGGPR